MLKFRLSIICLLFLPRVQAQSDVYPTMDVNGIEVEKNYTKELVFAAWGEPDKYYYQDDPEDGRTERYHYNNSQMIFSNGCLTYFYIEDPGFRVFSGVREGGFGVGDSIDSIRDAGISLIYTEPQPEPEQPEKGIWYTIDRGLTDDIYRIMVSCRGIISRITYVEPY